MVLSAGRCAVVELAEGDGPGIYTWSSLALAFCKAAVALDSFQCRVSAELTDTGICVVVSCADGNSKTLFCENDAGIKQMESVCRCNHGSLLTLSPHAVQPRAWEHGLLTPEQRAGGRCLHNEKLMVVEHLDRQR